MPAGQGRHFRGNQERWSFTNYHIFTVENTRHRQRFIVRLSACTSKRFGRNSDYTLVTNGSGRVGRVSSFMSDNFVEIRTAQGSRRGSRGHQKRDRVARPGSATLKKSLRNWPDILLRSNLRETRSVRKRGGTFNFRLAHGGTVRELCTAHKRHLGSATCGPRIIIIICNFICANLHLSFVRMIISDYQ
jgi:hypothetical protein